MQCIKPVCLKNNIDPSVYPDGLFVPCGKCIACRIKKRSEWTMRLIHELDSWTRSVFLTLTYTDECLPGNGSLRKRDLQLYIKRIRKAVYPDTVRYFAVGEYGDQTQRPHYHCIIFGLGLSDTDKQLMMDSWKYSDWSVDSIRSKAFGLVEPDSIRYVAQYIDKKLSGDLVDDIYTSTGREPVFRILSQGIGRDYIDKYFKDVEANGYISVNGVKMSIPRYYIERQGIDMANAKSRARDVEMDNMNDKTGVYCRESEYNRTASINDQISYNADVQRSRKQREKNLIARVKQKQKKL